MANEVKPMKVTPEEAKLWNEAAELEKINGKPSFNNWARHYLNKAANRALKKAKQ